jgi:hypothetical protein
VAKDAWTQKREPKRHLAGSRPRALNLVRVPWSKHRRGGSTMTKAKRSSRRKRAKAALAWGAAGVSLAMTGAASASAPATTVPSQDNARRLILAEEEISDVSLATFQVFDRENPPLSQGIKVARGGGCGCGGCGHGGGGGCGHAGFGGGCAHAGVGCAAGGRCAGGCGVGRCAVGGRCACRGGCACVGVFLGGACLGCAGCTGTCLQWDPYLGQWVYVCY